jgi:hypothetical protein
MALPFLFTLMQFILPKRQLIVLPKKIVDMLWIWKIFSWVISF